MLSANLSAIFYLISGVLFILALRGLSSPETSRQGNFFGILGMIIAITVTFLSIGNFSTGFVVVIIFLLIGGFVAHGIYRKAAVADDGRADSLSDEQEAQISELVGNTGKAE